MADQGARAEQIGPDSACPTCDGTGVALAIVGLPEHPGTPPCIDCDGTGRVVSGEAHAASSDDQVGPSSDV